MSDETMVDLVEAKLLKKYRGYEILYYQKDIYKTVWNFTCTNCYSNYEKSGFVVVTYFVEDGKRSQRWVEKSDDKSVMLARIKAAISEIEQDVDQYIEQNERVRVINADDDELFEIAAKRRM